MSRTIEQEDFFSKNIKWPKNSFQNDIANDITLKILITEFALHQFKAIKGNACSPNRNH